MDTTKLKLSTHSRSMTTERQYQSKLNMDIPVESNLSTKYGFERSLADLHFNQDTSEPISFFNILPPLSPKISGRHGMLEHIVI